MAIPRTIHQIWIGPHDPPTSLMDGWRLPGWDYRLWGDDDLEASWSTSDLLDRAEEFAPGDAIRFRVDVIRLEILARHGGIYVDCDTICLRPPDPLLEYRAFVAQSSNDTSMATNSVMGFEPEHPFILALLEGVADRAEQYKGHRLWESVGPKYVSDMLGAYDVEVLPWWLFTGRSIRDRNDGRRRDPRNKAEGFADHLYWNNKKKTRAWIPPWARRVRAAVRDTSRAVKGRM